MPSVSDIFAAMPQRFKADKAANVDAVVLFDLDGEGGGQWSVTVKDGQVNVSEGAVDNPTATVKMLADDYVAMTSGQLNPMNAFMMGKIKVQGDLSTVMKFQTLFM